MDSILVGLTLLSGTCTQVHGLFRGFTLVAISRCSFESQHLHVHQGTELGMFWGGESIITCSSGAELKQFGKFVLVENPLIRKNPPLQLVIIAACSKVITSHSTNVNNGR